MELELIVVAIFVDLFQRRRIDDALDAAWFIIASVSVRLVIGPDTHEYSKL